VGEEGFDLARPEVLGVAVAVESHEALHPQEVGALRAKRVMFAAKDRAGVVDQRAAWWVLHGPLPPAFRPGSIPTQRGEIIPLSRLALIMRPFFHKGSPRRGIIDFSIADRLSLVEGDGRT